MGHAFSENPPAGFFRRPDGLLISEDGRQKAMKKVLRKAVEMVVNTTRT
jgi:hypothetical protein